jgi:hypothetical protein
MKKLPCGCIIDDEKETVILCDRDLDYLMAAMKRDIGRMTN